MIHRRLVNQIADELGIDKRVVDEVRRHSLSFIRETIRNGKMQPILVHHFGTFVPKNSAYRQLKEGKKFTIGNSLRLAAVLKIGNYPVLPIKPLFLYNCYYLRNKTKTITFN
jgi:nucleoid DNA-binding protein